MSTGVRFGTTSARRSRGAFAFLVPMYDSSRLQFPIPSCQHHSQAYSTSLYRSMPSSSDEDIESYDLNVSEVFIRELEAKSREIDAQTRVWLQRVVIGMNLCPFAERPMKEGKLKIEVVRGRDEQVIVSVVLQELLERVAEPGTTLVVCPDLHPTSFESFLEVVSMIDNGLIPDHQELVDTVQVAPFHPLFQFEGSDNDAVDNWTNRSPYPMFHILREDEVSKAVDLLQGDAGKVWRRNVNLLTAMEEELGTVTVEELMTGKADDASQSKLQSLLRRFRVKVSSDPSST
ncbi:predicted protein [Phaeodactylum tricornutum CCAP 1055/1]|uniref:DUF1415 domain-containing protein n=1 Tax=Phaeodactylum tricornutum (strain CCAP 1055/1) TaxID=556484 RepID=B5Y3J8_PHATC|nr:predicted protein [Phaeodactylum tricornutum CCAP 1055/1]ACI65320.1 predicted protein [Phaeodactylum tricornutum CCAP 1055/1]|eukprot:XP_002185850.1 predicted protein [Phaeodactylum tricornutum CCAP 1055/1]